MNTITIHSDDILSDHELASIQGGFIPAVIAGVATWKIATVAVGSIGLVFAAGAGIRRIFHIITISTLLFSRIFLAVLQILHDLHYLTLPFETYGVSDLLSGILVIWILIIAYRGIRKEKSNEQFTTFSN